MSEPPDKIDEMLSGGRLGRPAQERVLGRVLAALDTPARASRRKRVLTIASGAGLLAAVAAVVLLFVGRSSPPPGSDQTAKGGARSVAAAI